MKAEDCMTNVESIKMLKVILKIDLEVLDLHYTYINNVIVICADCW